MVTDTSGSIFRFVQPSQAGGLWSVGTAPGRDSEGTRPAWVKFFKFLVDQTGLVGGGPATTGKFEAIIGACGTQCRPAGTAAGTPGVPNRWIAFTVVSWESTPSATAGANDITIAVRPTTPTNATMLAAVAALGQTC
jgi:hypothetical protein